MTRTKTIALLLLLVVAAGVFQAVAAPRNAESADDPAEPNPQAVKAFMRGKLDASQQVLEGLVTEDFTLIGKGADRLRVMSMRAEWNVLRGPVYADQSASFRRSAELMSKMAKEKNIDGAALAYLQMTMQCVSCHKFTRNADVVQARPHPSFNTANAVGSPER